MEKAKEKKKRKAYTNKIKHVTFIYMFYLLWLYIIYEYIKNFILLYYETALKTNPAIKTQLYFIYEAHRKQSIEKW